jgi:hypothetical protein
MDLRTSPSVNWISNSFFLPKPFFGNLTEFSMTKATQNSISPAPWAKNSPNQPSLNPSRQRLSKNIKSVANFFYNFIFVLIKIKFLMNIQMTSQP